MLTDEQAEAIVRSANKWTTSVAVTMSEKNACRAGAAWQREQDAVMVEDWDYAKGGIVNAQALANAIRRAGEQT